jgi:hypothetical protein
MRRVIRLFAYLGAGLTVLAAMLTPFLLFGWFTSAVAALGLHVDEVYSGGEVAATLARPGYRIVVYHPVVPRGLLPQVPPFVQIAWTPASALPAAVADDVDIDGDGAADLRAAFAVPRDPNAALHVDVTPLSPRVAAMHGVSRDSFASLVARVGDRIVVRVPLGGKR